MRPPVEEGQQLDLRPLRSWSFRLPGEQRPVGSLGSRRSLQGAALHTCLPSHMRGDGSIVPSDFLP